MILNLGNFLYLKPKILETIDTFRTKKKRADVNSIYIELCRNQASNIDEKAIASFVSELIKLNEIVNKKTNYGDSISKVINKANKHVTTLLANMTLEIDSTPSIDRNITPLLNNTVCMPIISNEKGISRKEDKQIKT